MVYQPKTEYIPGQEFDTREILFESVDDGTKAGFLVFDYVYSITLDAIVKQKHAQSLGDPLNSLVPQLSNTELMEGLLSLLHIYSRLDSGMHVSEFHHNDLTKRQIVRGLKDKKWYLLDFANSGLSYWTEMTVDGYSWPMYVSVPGDPSAELESEIFELYSFFLSGISDDLVDRVWETQGGGPHVSHDALQELMETLFELETESDHVPASNRGLVSN